MENQRVATIKRAGTGVAMILAPALMLVGFGVHPAESLKGAEQLQIIVDHPTQWNVAHLLLLLGGVCYIPAVMELLGRLRGRGAWFGLIGGAFSGLGVVFFGALMGVDALAPSALATLPADQRVALAAGMQALIDGSGAAAAGLIGFVLLLGLLTLAAGLLVARTAPRWAAVALAVGVFLQLFLNASHLIGMVGTAVTLVGLGFLGWQVLVQGASMRRVVPGRTLLDPMQS